MQSPLPVPETLNFLCLYRFLLPDFVQPSPFFHFLPDIGISPLPADPYRAGISTPPPASSPPRSYKPLLYQVPSGIYLASGSLNARSDAWY